MERALEYQKKSLHHVRVADHMLTMTYPLVKDPKLLVAVLENLFLATTNAMGAILYKERYFKRIPPFHDTFESKFGSFKMHIVRKMNIDAKWVRFIAQLKEIVNDHKKSTTEFPRREKYVMADEHYRMRTISEVELKKHLKKTKEFVYMILEMVRKE